MKKIVEIFDVGRQDGDVAVEIEVVGRRLPNGNLVPPDWRKEEDPSLRGPETAEYVSRGTVKILQLSYHLDNLKKAYEKCKTIFEDQTTAGTHVHINVQNLTLAQLISFACCYFIVEELLIDWCHPSRKGNHFCLRGKDAEYLVERIVQAVEDRNFNLLNTDEIRYSAINLMSVFKYGSVEFRALEGSPDFNRLIMWANMLYTIKENSLRFESPQDVYNRASGEGYGNFLSQILGPFAPILKKGNWEDKMRNGVHLSQDIAFARDWNTVNFNIFRKENNIF